MIPYGRQEITPEDVRAVVAVLESDFLTQGPQVPAFERAVAERVGVAHAVALNSATSALHATCLALGLGPGDRLWTTPNTFVASANCARYCGADADFVDIDPDTWNMSVPDLRSRLVRAKREGRLPKVVVPVHFAGQPTDQEAIWELAQEFGFRVIEDASHAIGARRRGESVGSCRYSDATVFSFHPVKIVTTAEGGMVLCNDAELAWQVGMVRSHGITRDEARFVQAEVDAPAWYYEQQSLGFNYRMTELQAALGSSQLVRLDHYLERRNALATRYGELLAGLPLQLPVVRDGNYSAFHLYVVRLPRPAGADERRRVFDALRDRGIGANLHYMPVHLQPYYRAFGFRPGMFPEAEWHGASAITLPLFPGLTVSEQDRVVDALRTALRRQ